MGKIESYIGFAIKSRKVVFGIDNIKIARKRMYLIVLCPTASENLKREAEYFSGTKEIPLIMTDVPLDELTFKNNCKIAAIMNKSLAKAVTDNIRR